MRKNLLKNILLSVLIILVIYLFFTSRNSKKNVNNVVKLDLLASELGFTNSALEEGLGLNYVYFYNAENYGTLQFGAVIKAMDQFYLEIIESTGGFKEGYAEGMLFNPSNTRIPEYVISNTNVLTSVKSELSKAIEIEQNPFVKKELERINDKIYGTNLETVSAAEIRLGYFIAKNKLYFLEKLTESNRH